MDNAGWQLDYDGWSEVWHRGPGGGFDRATVGTRGYAIALDDLTALRPRSADGCAICRGVLPHAFSHCLACGAPLADLAGPAETCQCVPNAGRPEAGLLPLTLAAGAAQREPFHLPPEGLHFAFAVAGEPVRLFALDRDGGVLHEFDRRRARWTRLMGLGENLLPERSWSMAASQAGIAVASAGRLTVIDLTAGPVPHPLVTRLGDGEACVGAPCFVRGEALALVTRGNAVHLARRRMVRGGEWAFEPVQGAPPATGALDVVRDAFSAPMATQTAASWAGRDGAVLVSLGDDDTVGRAVFRNWSAGFTPYLQHRPYVDPDGRVWQLGSMPIAGSKRGMGFERIGVQSMLNQERIGGSVLASGILACRLLTLRHRAWVEGSPYDRNLPGNDGDFLVPVLALDRERCVLMNASDGATELVNAGAAGVSAPVLAGLRYYDGQRLHDLGLPVNLRTLSQVAAFVFAGALHIYDSQENECWRWNLQTAE